MIKKDLLTGEEFETNRINQKFKDSKNRIKYNNERAKEFRRKTAYINKPLLKNLYILDELLTNKNEITVHRQFLMGRGFSFDVFNHYELYNGIEYSAIYQYTIIVINKEHIKIIKND